MAFNKFTSIDSFKDVWHNARKRGDFLKVEYQKVIKLHGTNGAIRFEDGVITAQKRTSDCFVDDDNQGFARFVEDTKRAWHKIFSETVSYYNIPQKLRFLVNGQAREFKTKMQ